MAAMTFPTITPQIEARYWPKVDKRGPDECWHWLGRCTDGRYGLFIITAGPLKGVMATHTALALDGRPRVETEHHALHSCNNPPCVNPKHLRWGTKEENIEDMRKERARRRAAGIVQKCTPRGQHAFKTTRQG